MRAGLAMSYEELPVRSAGADLDLLKACGLRDIGAVKEALARGADANCEYEMEPGSFPLILAVFPHGDIAIVDTLLAHGANPNASNGHNTALMLAARAGNSAVVRALLAAGADPNVMNQGGDTALIWAQSEGHVEVVEILRRLTATELARGVNHGVNVLLPALDGSIRSATGSHRLLLEHLRSFLVTGDMRFQVAAKKIFPTLDSKIQEDVYFFIRHGARLCGSIEQGKALYDIAEVHMFGTPEELEEAIKLGKISREAINQLLFVALRNRSRGMTEVLLRHGADTSVEKDGWQAIHWAVKMNDSELVRLVLEHGGDANARNAQGETPREMARVFSCSEVVIRLITGSGDRVVGRRSWRFWRRSSY